MRSFTEYDSITAFLHKIKKNDFEKLWEIKNKYFGR